MDTIVLRPRFSETDALGHVSNTTLPIWFEAAREDFFKRIHPQMTIHDWPLILARMEIDLKAQIYLGSDVTIKTGLKKIGNSSLIVYHEAFQKEQLVATGTFAMVYFDYSEQRSKPVPDEVRERLQELIIE